jgi:tetratricopeptide (TPR) repeat protein
MAVAAGMILFTLPGFSQQPAQKWKDRAEYDLYTAIAKEQDPAKRLQLLNSWKEKYPTSDLAPLRLDVFVQTYNALRQPDKVLAAGLEALQANPQDLTALYLMALNVQLLSKPSADDLAAGDKAANGILSNLDTFFGADKKPATTTDAAWTQAKTQAETLAHTTLGWVALQKKDDENAEKELTKALQLSPNGSTSAGAPVDSAQISSWLGTAIAHEAIAQKKPERYPEALFQFARAASLDQSQGGYPAAGRQPFETYFVNAFNRYHGQDAPELAKLRELAKSQPFPPQGWTLKDVNTLKSENEEKFKKENPGLALWMNLKQALVTDGGDKYFESIKETEVPGGAGGVQTFKGKLISSKPALHPKELVLSIGDGTTPDVTLHLDAPLPGKSDPGVDIEFSGVPSAFTKEPFMITFDVEKKKIGGWPGKDAPARRATKKKG